MRILRKTEKSIVRAMCGVQLKDRKISKDLMLMLSLKETIDQLATTNCSLVWSCVEERGWSRLVTSIRF